MYERRFTNKAEKAISLSQTAANELGHNYIGSEHILLGLIKEGTGIAAQVLKSNGLNEENTKEAVIKLIGKGNTPAGNKPLTPRVKRALELSYEIALELGSTYIGTEHILLALTDDTTSVAAKITDEISGSVTKVKDDILNFLRDGDYLPHSDQHSNSPKHRGNTATPSIDEFGNDLTKMAADNKVDPVIGRDEEIERVIQILSRRTKNNPCLIGEPGVGKTAIIEGLAQKIIANEVPETLKGKRVITIDLTSMIAGSKYRGEFEDRIKKVLQEVKDSQNIILFIDEIHTIVGAGAAEGAIDAANILKPSLARGEIQLIGATTLNEYRKYIEKDAALERRFQPVTVDEPSEEEALKILMGVRDKYEAHHKTQISDEALKAAVQLSQRYITDRFLPDKALDLIDEAASKIKLKTLTTPPDLKGLEDELTALATEKEEAISAQDYEHAATLRDKENEIKKEIEEKKNEHQNKSSNNNPSVTAEDIAEIVSSWTKIPIKRLTEEESTKLLNLENILHERVIGQEEAVKSVAHAIRRGRAGLKDPKRPIGSFLFLGPTGVGKTELSKALADVMFGSQDAMIRIDMSEYMEKHSVSRLIGSPPGYVGYDEGGQLTEKVRRNPYSVVLFDEIEKAHPDIFNAMLQILEDGILTDSQGRKVDFKNTIIIMTSNVGARLITETKKSLGFSADANETERNYETIKNTVMQSLKQEFRPEFINRIDDIIVFHQLNKENMKDIAKIMLSDLTKRLAGEGITPEFSDDVYDYLIETGFDSAFGARPLRRAIQTKIEDLLSEEILKGNIKNNTSILISIEDNAPKVTVK